MLRSSNIFGASVKTATVTPMARKLGRPIDAENGTRSDHRRLQPNPVRPTEFYVCRRRYRCRHHPPRRCRRRRRRRLAAGKCIVTPTG